jgi:hypothetical protein
MFLLALVDAYRLGFLQNSYLCLQGLVFRNS